MQHGCGGRGRWILSYLHNYFGHVNDTESVYFGRLNLFGPGKYQLLSTHQVPYFIDP